MSPTDPAPLTTRQAAALASSAGRELAFGLRAVRSQLRGWSARASEIPDPAIRRLVLQGMREGRALVDGAALFWTLPRRRNHDLLRALVALQSLLNFIDIVLERDARQLGQPRHWTWLVGCALDAFGPPPQIDIISSELGDDGGYFSALLIACRHACRRLPSYPAAREILLREARRSVSFEIEHEADDQHRRAKIQRWAGAQFADHQLAPFELAGGASSLLSAMAVLGVAGDPNVTTDQLRKTADAYAWVGSAAALMDSYTDLADDQVDGSHNWFDYYNSTDTATSRARVLLSAALTEVLALPHGEHHAVIVGAMAALALSADSGRVPARRAATTALTRSGGTLTRVLVPILRAWRISYDLKSDH